ncbi:PAS domain S-box-containing protein [Arcticibacter tournemirensis]|uniref:histidine kinase n=1 Tax=Arcticibacter tournemirensis TaxID=699437 RepID=A0A5M9HE27_9SPHI|nr:HAMP domain-containing sensor histidine kinase [Arcticibacter tournemirensis]KAA8485030.1 PAS domain S-box protein [Arcticibacter tournemirensis]TQM50514.1 PAS domain S-box-containing protein [Arcticibacter tournemirensis]
MTIESDNKNSGLHAINALNAYQQAVNSAAIVSITDKRGIITYVNELFCQISKYQENELVGNNHRIINSNYHPKSFFSSLWRTISTGNVWHGEVRNKAKDGSFYWVDTTISPMLNNDGHITHYLSIRSLITERKRLEKERERLLSELTQKYNALMQFNYIVSHNLRVPIANILGLTGLLRSENTADTELIDMVHKSAESMDMIIKDLTSLLAVRTPINESLEEISLSDIISSVKNTLSTQISSSGAIIREHISPDAENIYTFKAYFQSIVYNLLSNAIKYHKTGTSPLINLKARREKDAFVLSVKDNGVGMDLDAIGNKLFGLYKRFDLTREGRGVGLHFTKTQVETLGGQISVKSKPGLGTVFTITLKNLF